MKVLLLEDDADTAEYIERGLREEGHAVDCCANGLHGLSLAHTTLFDVVILDRNLPGLDGLSVVERLRAEGSRVPVLFLTSLGGIDARVESLEAGGDDYLVKPFAFSELLARLIALCRRPPRLSEETVLTLADLKLDLVRRTVTRSGATVELQPREFDLLEVLMRNKGRILTRSMLLERVWNFHFKPKTSVVETHISRLRAKIDKPFGDELLHTVRGIGYSMDLPR